MAPVGLEMICRIASGHMIKWALALGCERQHWVQATSGLSNWGGGAKYLF